MAITPIEIGNMSSYDGGAGMGQRRNIPPLEGAHTSARCGPQAFKITTMAIEYPT